MIFVNFLAFFDQDITFFPSKFMIVLFKGGFLCVGGATLDIVKYFLFDLEMKPPMHLVLIIFFFTK